jgi:hypothetical protein
MRSRARQLGILIALGVTLGLLLTRGWREAPPAVPAPTVEAAGPANSAVSDSPAPAARTFKLPALRLPVAATDARGAPPDDPVSATVVVPKYWLLRGTSPQSYEISADRQQVHNGELSVRIKAHDEDISPTLNGSVMQNVAAQSLLGRRLEVSAFLRAEDVREGTVALWFTAVDPNDALLAADSSRTAYPKITDQWTRVRFVVDVPPIAAELNYGVTLTGKGTAWVDDLRLTTVDPDIVAITGTALPKQLGQTVSPARSDREPLPRPENLDFEETMEVNPAWLRDKPPTSLTEIRY